MRPVPVEQTFQWTSPESGLVLWAHSCTKPTTTWSVIVSFFKWWNEPFISENAYISKWYLSSFNPTFYERAQLARWVSDGVLQYSYVEWPAWLGAVCGVMVGKEGYILSGPHMLCPGPAQARPGGGWWYLLSVLARAQWCPGTRTAQISSHQPSQGYQRPVPDQIQDPHTQLLNSLWSN